MRIDIISVVPELLSGPFNSSIIKKAIDKKIIQINIHNLRDYSTNNYRSIDDYQYGGGAGMVMLIEPIDNCITELKKDSSVISLGGGAFLNNDIRRAVKKFSFSFWLDINLNILINRLKRSKKRPLLFKKNIGEAVGKIYFERKKIYSEADFKVRCDKLKTDTIVNKILKIYENA